GENRRLKELPAGFVTTGTLTPFRRRQASKICASLLKAGIDPVYRHMPFKDTPGAHLADDKVVFESADAKSADYLFNVNPPQRENWPFSSPMRLLRAILLGQIPVITKRFGDHE